MPVTAEPPARTSSRIRRQRKAREHKYVRQARRHRHPDNAGPGYLLDDPAFWQARSVGFDVARKDIRHREPPVRVAPFGPNPHYNAGDPEFLASADCATWRWWQALTPEQRHGFYEATHAGDAPAGVRVTNMGLELTNPSFVIESW